ncbi:polysaccharide deacetylase family protein [Microbulbifer sp. OS29]|uniref:Polysaccharide deacetylase family protein n=1 Tax=Microbulbifer okhotskensis TaxID=2926617 RepID=A0A9X2ESV0_9GAMM|nr:polysaccharide deacetylase family protein [Microbulbifer okhotskensis]MCO1335138.1 polysaccharide deacetylase family protein [Microbulbifer okhotskensis]
MYEYGSRVGAWRILDIFESFNVPLTIFATGKALELNPALAQALVQGGHELAGHGYRWLDYKDIPRSIEKQHIHLTVKLIEKLTGRPLVGWYTGRISAHTRTLVSDIAGLLYTSDAYNDDLPYWLYDKKTLLVIPYTLVNNDIQYFLPGGCATSADFFQLLKDAFDQLWLEGNSAPKLMSVGLHGRISGHPARARAVYQFLQYVADFESVWFCRREEIARHWISTFPASG